MKEVTIYLMWIILGTGQTPFPVVDLDGQPIIINSMERCGNIARNLNQHEEFRSHPRRHFYCAPKAPLNSRSF